MVSSPLPHILLLPKHQPPPITGINTCDAPEPPANIASPSFGSEVAARYDRATLRAAVVQTPLVALKMSTVLTATLFAPAQRISNQQQWQQHTSPLPHTLPLPTHHPPAISDISTYDALEPPANIASPSFGSDVAARSDRATLRAAVVQIPLVTLNMSTLFTTPLDPA